MKLKEIKAVIIPIGLPGSGKSQFAKIIKLTMHKNAIIHSADEYMKNIFGKYEWNTKNISRAHKKTLKEFEKSLREEVSVIIIDNLNLKVRDRRKYSKLAEVAGYEVILVIVGNFTVEACKKYAKTNKFKFGYEKILNLMNEAELPGKGEAI